MDGVTLIAWGVGACMGALAMFVDRYPRLRDLEATVDEQAEVIREQRRMLVARRVPERRLRLVNGGSR